MIDTWCSTGISDIDQNVGLSPAVQDAAAIRAAIPGQLPQLTATATRLYTCWIGNLRK
jgi:nitroreductase